MSHFEDIVIGLNSEKSKFLNVNAYVLAKIDNEGGLPFSNDVTISGLRCTLFPLYFLFDLDVGRAWKTSPRASSISGGDLNVRHFWTNKLLLVCGEE